MANTTIKKVVLTGGPCGGKTSGIASLTAAAAFLGWRPFVVPEAATILKGGGIDPAASLVAFQVRVLKMQIYLEDYFTEAARSSGAERAVIFCDRGALDGKSFCRPYVWRCVLRTLGSILDRSLVERYDGVIHLVTAADGAESHYSSASNAVRGESPREARAVDRKLQDAWSDHPSRFIIKNDSAFLGKMAQAAAALTKILES